MREKRASIFIIIITLIISLIYFGYLLYGAKSENSYLESFNSDLQSKVSTLSDENNTLKAELDELKNGATNRIIEIRQLYEEEKYNEVITKANELHEKFNGTAEDNEAQRLVMRSNDMINKINQATMEAEQKKLEEEKKTIEDKVKEIIRVTKLAKSKPNSAGGVDLFIGFENKSEKVIKYITFDVIPYNAVGDPVKCDIRRRSLFGAKSTGPYNIGEGLEGDYSGYWENAWYNYHVETLSLNEINIEYMDGTTVTLSGEELNYVQY